MQAAGMIRARSFSPSTESSTISYNNNERNSATIAWSSCYSNKSRKYEKQRNSNKSDGDLSQDFVSSLLTLSQ
ncbi:hypothetical protein CDAR_12131, partial [Caerostris darwini]